MKLLIALAAFVALSVGSVPPSYGSVSTADTQSLLEDLMAHVKSGTVDGSNEKVLYARSASESLTALARYEDDTSRRVREHAFVMEWHIGVKSAQSAVQTDVVERLAHACADSDALVWQSAAERLLSFPPQCFSEKAKQSILGLLCRRDRQGYAAMIAGQANMTDAAPAIRAMITKENSFDTPNFRLALARLGSKDDITYYVGRLRSEKDDVRRLRMLAQLGYIRQPEAVRAIKEVLDSDKRLPNEIDFVVPPPVPVGQGPLIAEYALDVLANTLEGCPVPPRHTYTAADIESARAWMSTQTSYTFVSHPTEYRPMIL